VVLNLKWIYAAMLCRRECSELHQPSEAASRAYERVFEEYLRLCSTLRDTLWR